MGASAVKGEVLEVRGIGRVVYVPGHAAHSVTGNGQKDVTRQYECPIPRAETPNRSLRVTIDRLSTHGLAAAVAALALAAIADGVTMLLLAWLIR